MRAFDKFKYLRHGLVRFTALYLLLGLLAGCATPIGVVRGTTQQTYYALTSNVLSAGTPSSWSTQVLHRNDLFDRFENDPAAALAELHKRLKDRITPDRLFALAELSFFYAEQSGKREYYLAAAAYAYAFILPGREDMMVRPIDPRVRLAVDLYNWGISRGLTSPDGEEVLLEAGTRALPFGEMALTVEPSQFLWGGYRFKRFIPVGEFVVRGLRNRYRQAGAGAALAAEVELVGSAAAPGRERIPPRSKVPVTAFVRFAEPLRTVVEGKIQGHIEIYAADQATTVRVGERDVPLELEPTAALAYQLEGAPAWDFEIAGFRLADPQMILGDGLILMHPYRRGRIPVVLVHGTASSPVRWAEMYNELMHDPIIEGRYQFWFFQYNTGQPILYSAMLLRRALKAVVKELDPNGEDSYFEDDGTKRAKGVIFIATPHRGSYQATGWVLNLVRRFIRLPGALVSQFQDLLQGQTFAHLGVTQLPTSVDNMSPGHPFLRALNDLKIGPGITAHSIIAVLGDGPLTGRTDGIVAYESAHIEGVESEKVVRSGHSTQSHPETIEEVRRILREHVGVR
jgi:hypothetical protein